MSKVSPLVRDVMTREVLTVSRGTTLSELLKKFQKFHTFPLVPVVEEDGRLVGTILFEDLVEIFQAKGMSLIKGVPFLDRDEIDIFSLDIDEESGVLFIVEDLLKRKFLYLNDDLPLEKAYTAMKLNSVDTLPVIDKEGKLVGMLGIFDILRAIFKEKGIIK